MNVRRSRGIILAVGDHGESDKIVTLYSPDLGRATAIAKGAKRSKKRFVNKLEEFTCLRIFYRRGKRGGLIFLGEAELENAFLSLRRHYDRFVVATMICELINLFTGEQDPDPRLYSLLAWSFRFLDRGNSPLRAAIFFHLKILSLTGYQPDLFRCRSCGEPVGQSRQYGFQAGSGSLFCAGCRRQKYPSSQSLSLRTVKILQRIQSLEPPMLERLHFDAATIRETLAMLHRYSRHLLQREIRSHRLVDALQRL